MSKPLTAAVLAALLAGCAGAPQKPAAPAKPYDYTANPYPSTYQRVASPPVLLQHATVLTGTGTRLDAEDVLMRDGRLEPGVHLLSKPYHRRDLAHKVREALAAQPRAQAG